MRREEQPQRRTSSECADTDSFFLPSLFVSDSHRRTYAVGHTKQYYEAPPALADILAYMNLIFTMLFSLECILKLAAFGFKVLETPPFLLMLLFFPDRVV